MTTATRTPDELRASIDARAAVLADMERDRPCGHAGYPGAPTDGPAIAASALGGDAGPILAGQVAVREPYAAVSTRRARIDGAKVLDGTRTFLGRFADYPSSAARDAITLWGAHAHIRDGDGRLATRATPRLLLMSSQPGSGKSRVLELLGRICPYTYGLDTEPTAAGLAHTLDKEHATALLDEADIMFGKGQRKEAVRAIINSGYTRNGTVLRMRGSKAERARVFGPIAMAGLDVLEKATGDSLAALLDRCVIIRMTRSAAEVPDLGDEADHVALLIRRALAMWCQGALGELAAAEPVMPEGIRGRAAQIWRPLLAVADVAGGDWPDRARAACDELVTRGGVSDEDEDDTMAELDEIFGQWAGDAEMRQP